MILFWWLLLIIIYLTVICIVNTTDDISYNNNHHVDRTYIPRYHDNEGRYHDSDESKHHVNDDRSGRHYQSMKYMRSSKLIYQYESKMISHVQPNITSMNSTSTINKENKYMSASQLPSHGSHGSSSSQHTLSLIHI